MPAREQVAAFGFARPRAVRVAPKLVLPVDDVAGGIERSRKVHRHRGAVRLPREFVVAHPLQLDRPAFCFACDERGVERHVVGAVLSVAARAFAMNDDDVRRRYRQCLGKIAAQWKHALRMAPDGELALAPLRHRARGADRSVRRIRPRVVGLDALDRLRRSLHVDLFANDRVLRARALHGCEERGAGRRQVGGLVPLCRVAQRLRSDNRLFLAFSRHGKEAPVARDGRHAGQRAHRGIVERDELGMIGRRANDAAEQHVGQPHVLHIRDSARDLRRNIAARNARADHGVRRGRPRLGFGARLAAEQVHTCHLPIGRALAVRRGDDAVGHGESGCRHADLRRRGSEQDFARFGGCEPQRGSSLFDRQAAGRHAFVRRARRIAGDNRDARNVDAELVGDDLRQRCRDSLSQLDLARKHSDRFVRVDREPGVELPIGLQAARKRRRRALRIEIRRERERDRDGGAALQERPARGAGKEGSHAERSFAARCTARTIRLCVPQRHRFPASAARICASDGSGFCDSSACALIIIPAMQ